MAIKAQNGRKSGRRNDAQRSEKTNNKDINALPATFKFAAETLKMMSERGGSAGSIVVSKYRNYNYKLIFALVMNTAKNIKIIKKIIHETKLMNRVPESNPFMLEILVGDLLFGKNLKSVEQNATAAAVLKLKVDIIKQQTKLKKEFGLLDDNRDSAKYLRINHLRSNKDHIISQLKTVGLTQFEYSKDKIKFKKFVNKFKSLSENEFMLDFHFPDDLIVLKPAALDKLRKTDLMKKRKALLQDKASFMAVEAMDVKPNQKIIDACCAPGCKTALIANKMKNKGKILAFDANKKRLISAINLLKLHGVTCAKLEVQDFSRVKLNRLLKTNNIDLFDCVLLDPSCSGSGIQSRVDYKKSDKEIGRLKKLQAFQVSLLKHVLQSNASKSVVYSTCSSSTEENEQVVEMALRESERGDHWEVVDVLPYWMQRGDPSFEFGHKCVRSDPVSLTNGFFIAKLQRKNLNVEESSVKKMKVEEDQGASEPMAQSEAGNESDADEESEFDEESIDDEENEEDDDEEEESDEESEEVDSES